MAKRPSLKRDLKTIDVPFDLYTGLSLVIEEMKTKKFAYKELIKDASDILIFKSVRKKESISINIEKDNLLIRQYSLIDKDRRKLKVLYVVKPTERIFKLV